MNPSSLFSRKFFGVAVFVGFVFVGAGCSHWDRLREDRPPIARRPNYEVRDLGEGGSGFPIDAPDFGLNNSGQVSFTRRRPDTGANPAHQAVFFFPGQNPEVRVWQPQAFTNSFGGGTALTAD